MVETGAGMKKLRIVLENKEKNHILPFLWMHGEEEGILREYMQKIKDSNISAVCLEARPHPEFVGNRWWRDVDIILDEAKKRDMKLWILDDAHFPTGYANGAIKEQYPHLRKRFLKLYQLDFAGPQKYGRAIIKYAFTDSEDEIIGVYLAKKTGFDTIDETTIIDITDNVQSDQTVTFNLPQGEWKLLVTLSTWNGGEPHTENYLNPIDPDATDVLIKEVYEAHFSHYKEEFGKTISGFFSDEPRFGNIHGAQGSIGRADMVLPWRKDLLKLLAEQMGQSIEKVKKELPLLFIDGEISAHQIRYHYMNLISELYAENFSRRIGNWCRAHGVEYIGHVIEDNNASARLGYGAGHFFRSMRGQDMAGIDVVLNQIMPGMDYGINKSMTYKGWDGEFFHYVLGKLGASLGHLDALKKGRVMCEVYGAYGWSEGNRLMKWLTDYMLVRGVNEFVPHAFDPKEYPDEDCPPHFYAHGQNPQFQNFKILMKYTNRMAELLSGGRHIAPVAVGYHGEAEWSGNYMLEQIPCAELTRNQIDFDIVSVDMVIHSAIEDSKMRIEQEFFRALIVPYAEALPFEYMKKMLKLAKAGIPVFVLQSLPVRCSEGHDVSKLLEEMKSYISVVQTDELVTNLWERNLYDIRTLTYEPYLRYYRYEQKDMDILMLVNEATAGTIETEVELQEQPVRYRYDAFENTLMQSEGAKELAVRLTAGESAVYVWPKKNVQKLPETYKEKEKKLFHSISLETDFDVTFKSVFIKDREKIQLKKLIPIQMIKGKEEFAGVIKYEKEFQLNEVSEVTILKLDTVYESASVRINGKKEQIKICPPYQFDISEYIVQGKNRLEIEISTTLGSNQKDVQSQYMLLEPMGITDRVLINQYKTVDGSMR